MSRFRGGSVTAPETTVQLEKPGVAEKQAGETFSAQS